MLLTVVVLSYNRPQEIKCILNRLIGFSSADFSLIVKDDASPLQDEIIAIVESYKDLLSIPVFFHCNSLNLGYDRNLLNAFDIVQSEYLMLLSDDDYLDGNHLDELMMHLQKRSHKLYFTPYLDNGNIRRSQNSGYSLNKFSDVIYNSILFSGLVFDVDSVRRLKLDREFLSNCIYTQVYLASCLVFHEKNFGFLPAGALRLGGDGENFFGLNQSATNSELLSDRKKITSNLIYQRFLLLVVEAIAHDTDPLVATSFAREYRMRLLAYALRVRAEGIASYFLFIKEFLKGASFRSLGSSLLFLSFLFIPKSIARGIYEFGVRRFRRSG